MARAKVNLNGLRFGIEIETVGQTRDIVAQAILNAIGGGRIVECGGTYGTYEVHGTDGRTWKVMSDSSLSAAPRLQAEIVSPILTYGDGDVRLMQDVVRAVRTQARSRTDSSCGIHVHVDAEHFEDGEKIGHLAKICYSNETLIERAIGIESRRRAYCRGINERFIERLCSQKPKTKSELNRAWYGNDYVYERPYHYHGSRYTGLNLHNVWFRGTVEFRWFNSTLHAGRVKTCVQFALALAKNAMERKRTIARKRECPEQTARYDTHHFLHQLGMSGSEFKTARHFLTERVRRAS